MCQNGPSPAYIDLIYDLLHMRNGCRELLRLMAFSHGPHLSSQGQHSILGGVTDVLFVEPAPNQRSLVVALDAVIESRCRTLRLCFSATG